MGLLLFIVSLILLGIVGALGAAILLVATIVLLPYNLLMNTKGLFLQISLYFERMAIAIDILGNVMLAPIWNLLLIDDIQYIPYGSPQDTISGVTGVNEQRNNLRFLGRVLAYILNKIDKDHTIKAAENYWKFRGLSSSVS